MSLERKREVRIDLFKEESDHLSNESDYMSNCTSIRKNSETKTFNIGTKLPPFSNARCSTVIKEAQEINKILYIENKYKRETIEQLNLKIEECKNTFRSIESEKNALFFQQEELIEQLKKYEGEKTELETIISSFKSKITSKTCFEQIEVLTEILVSLMKQIQYYEKQIKEKNTSQRETLKYLEEVKEAVRIRENPKRLSKCKKEKVYKS